MKGLFSMPYRHTCLALLLVLGFPLRLWAAPCAEVVHTNCLADEIAAYREAAQDVFERQRIGMSLARAQLAAGLADEAKRTIGELEQPWQRAAFLADEAAYLLTRENKRDALASLRRANELLGSQTPVERLNHAGTDMRLARLMARAGEPLEGKALLDKLAQVRTRGMPMNAMMLALMLQVAQAMADIGYREEAAQLARASFAQGFADDMPVSPEQLFHLYSAWAKADPGAAPRDDATILARELEEEQSWLYAGVVWAGPATAPGTNRETAAGMLDNARKALEKAPERAAALPWQARVAALLYQAGKTEQGQGVFEDVRKQAQDLPEIESRMQVRFELAKAQAAMGDTVGAARELRTLAEQSRQAKQTTPAIRVIAMNTPAELAKLGRADDAYELAMADGADGTRELAVFAAANRLALQKDYAGALRFARAMPDAQAAMVMAAMAARMAGLDAGDEAAP